LKFFNYFSLVLTTCASKYYICPDFYENFKEQRCFSR